jgi:hypothetical protein
MGVQPRGHGQRLVARIDGRQHLLRRQQFQARQQRRVAQHHLFHAIDGANQGLGAFHQRIVLAPRNEVRPQKRTDQPPTRREPAALHALVQGLYPREIAVGAALQQFVVPTDCVVQQGHF